MRINRGILIVEANTLSLAEAESIVMTKNIKGLILELNHLSLDCAQVLSQLVLTMDENSIGSGLLSLKLPRVSQDVLQELIKISSQFLYLTVEMFTESLAKILCKSSTTYLTIKWTKCCTNEAIKEITKWSGKCLGLSSEILNHEDMMSGLIQWKGQELSFETGNSVILRPSIAKILSSWKGNHLFFWNFDEMSVEAATYLSNWKGKMITFSQYCKVSDCNSEVIKQLFKFSGEITIYPQQAIKL